MATAPIEPPRRLVRAIGDDPGSPARAWLDSLPDRVAERLAAWELTLERVHEPGGRASLLVLVTQADGTPAALKFPLPGRPGAEVEAAALTRWDGWGAARLLRADPDSGALLLERLRSGVSLRSLPEAKALLEAAGTVRRLWIPPGEDHPFETLAARTEAAVVAIREQGAAAPSAGPLIDEAAELRGALPADAPEEVLLHGAFRQGKVLAGHRTPWLTVGPRPVVGERAHDLVGLVLDRMEDLAAGTGAASAARRRVTKLADSLDVDRDRLRAWTLITAVETGLRAVATDERARGELLLEFATWL